MRITNKPDIELELEVETFGYNLNNENHAQAVMKKITDTIVFLNCSKCKVKLKASFTAPISADKATETQRILNMTREELIADVADSNK